MSRQCSRADPLLNAALRYYDDFGWCVIPVVYGQKVPLIQWGQYQETRPDRAQVQKWFAFRKVNVGAVLGHASGDLTCRDFDAIAAYTKWANNYPELARTLPTARTARGYHVYFVGRVDGIRYPGDGELRGSGGICVLPPSRHPDGVDYTWINAPTKKNLVVVEPEKAGFLEKNVSVTERTENTERTDENRRDRKAAHDVFVPAQLVEVNQGIHAAIERTLPQEYGTRHRHIFDFVRELKSMPQYMDADPQAFRAVVQQWHRRALPNIKTEEFEETWIDFLKAWPEVKYKIGEGPMAEMFNRAIRLTPPAVVVGKYPSNRHLQLLAALCHELQKTAGDGPFFLSCRTAAGLMGVSAVTVSRWLFLLEADGILKTVAKGGTKENPRKASRFRYLADIDEPVA